VTDADKGLSRRGLLYGAAAASGLAVGAAGGVAAGAATAGRLARSGNGDAGEELVDLSVQHAFYGEAEQAGIRTPPQRYSVYMTFDMASPLKRDLQVLLARWSGAIAQLMKGKTIGNVEPNRVDGIGVDTGEALDLGPAGLTVTLGLGPKLFSEPSYGLAAQRPALMRELKTLPSDRMKPELTGGDLSLQACAEDPQVAYHAIRDLARMAKGTAATRWTVMGFGRASAGKGQSTPRNLMGYKDGTRNIREDSEFDEFVWVKDGPSWTRGGSYQVARKIQMNIENWDADRVSDQNAVFGRDKRAGAPLSGGHEFTTPDFHAKGGDGVEKISPTSHIALAAHENNGGIKILRRGYNYTDGLNQYGLLDAGLLFISYQNDPAHFETLQAKLGSSDRLNEYVSHIGSGLFFVPPAPKPGHYLAEGMFT
jgi:deferrochelatase/peroxidase EfeB